MLGQHLVEGEDLRVRETRHLGAPEALGPSGAAAALVLGQLPRAQPLLGVLQDVSQCKPKNSRVLDLIARERAQCENNEQ